MSRFEDGYEAATRRDADVQRGGAVKEVNGGAGWETLLVQKGATGQRRVSRGRATGPFATPSLFTRARGERPTRPWTWRAAGAAEADSD
jgi:hypothetical protein